MHKLGLIVLALSLIACKGSRATNTAALAVVPADTSVLVGLDPSRILKNAFVKPAAERMYPDVMQKIAAARELCGLEFEETVSTLLVATRFARIPGDKNADILIAGFAVDKGKILECFGKLNIQIEAAGKFLRFQMDRDTLTGYWAKDNLLLLAADDSVTEEQFAAMVGGGGIASGSRLAQNMKQIDMSSVAWAAGELGDGIGDGMRDLHATLNGLEQTDIKVVVGFNNDAHTQEFLAQVDDIRRDMQKTFPSLEKVKVQRDGTRVTGTAVFTDADAHTFFNKSMRTKEKDATLQVMEFAQKGYIQWTLKTNEECPQSLADLAKYTNVNDTKDAWGQELGFICGSTGGLPEGVMFGVYSIGVDGKNGTDDDIKSWERPRRL